MDKIWCKQFIVHFHISVYFQGCQIFTTKLAQSHIDGKNCIPDKIYIFFWKGSPGKISIPGAKYHVIGCRLWTWKPTRGNSVKVAQFHRKIMDLATLNISTLKSLTLQRYFKKLFKMNCNYLKTISIKQLKGQFFVHISVCRLSSALSARWSSAYIRYFCFAVVLQSDRGH